MKKHIFIARKQGNILRDAGGFFFLLLTQRYHKHPLVVVDEDDDGPELPVQTQTSPNRSKAQTKPPTHEELKLCSPIPGKTEETEIEMQVRNTPGASVCNNVIQKA